jgi:polar amino acid transport system substrate-binding protein
MTMTTLLASCAGILLSAAVAGAAPSDAAKDLAPSGRLRAAINFGNPVLAQRDPATGEARGVSVALARELGRQLDVPVDLVPFTEAGQVFAAAKAGAWDIAFLAIDPVRAADIDFTAAYVVIEGVYAVPAASPLQRIEDIDRDGIRIGVTKGSAYDLFLARTLKQAQIVRAANSAEAVDLLPQGTVDALAGVKQPLVDYAATHPEMRVIPGRFMEIDQAMGVPKGREAGRRFLAGFVEAMKSSGFVAKALAASGQADVAVAPPAP